MGMRQFIALATEGLENDVAKAVICIETYLNMPETQYNAFLLKSGQMEVWKETQTGTIRVKGAPINRECRKYFKKTLT